MPDISGFEGARGGGALDEFSEFVAIDLETTGLDPAADRITEVGATRFDRAGASSHFQSLVNPGRPIPQRVTELTGIADADVARAPTITAVGAELSAYVGGRPVVGHNVSFDLEFLHAAGVTLAAPAYDTFELASVLLPTATRLDLRSLTELLGVPTQGRHRALPDAEASRDVFLRLLTLLERLPRAVLLDLEAIAARADWEPGRLFAAALERGTGERAGAAPAPALTLPPPGSPPPALAPRPSEQEPRPPTDADIERLFDAAAARPELLGGFERRGGQVQMAQAVARNIAAGGHLAVESGTGTGKSLAYLLPSLLHALRHDDRVVISTHTLNLQEQLAGSDIPVAAALVEEHERRRPGALRVATLKGRANYLCLERWAEAREVEAQPAPARAQAQARLHARIAVWLPHTQSGDVAELYMRAEERPGWAALSAEGNDCLARRCPYVRDGSCFLLRARQRAAAAHVVVVNHALLLAGAAAEQQALPPFRQLVIDEAHRLEGVATQQYGAALSLRELDARVEALRAGDGPAGRLRTAATADASPLSQAAGLAAAAQEVGAAAQRASDRVPAVEAILRGYAQDRLDGTGADGGANWQEVALGSARHSQPLWAEVEETAIQLDVTLHHLGGRIEHAREAAAALPLEAAPGLARLRAELGREAEAIGDARRTLDDVVLRNDPGQIAWLRVSERDVALNLAPLEVAERLAADLYAGRDSVTATSATLTAAGSFDFSTRRLGLLEPETLQVPSPFDYRRAVLAILVEDLPEPNAAAYAAAAHRVLAAAAEAAEGRTLALFTSRRAIRAAAAALRQPLGARGISLLAQELDGSPARLLRALAEQPRTLLLGTAAFWEGIDVRGETLSQIAVARLPFPVPTEPVYAGRAEQYDDPFGEYALPQAVLRFRQGFGRLIRGSTERGVFLVLDSRITSRRYGEAFLDGLPDCELRRLPASAVADAVAGWLAPPHEGPPR